MYSNTFKQFAGFFNLIALGFFTWMWTMAMPLFTFENDLDPRAFALMHFAPQANDHRLNV